VKKINILICLSDKFNNVSLENYTTIEYLILTVLCNETDLLLFISS